MSEHEPNEEIRTILAKVLAHAGSRADALLDERERARIREELGPGDDLGQRVTAAIEAKLLAQERRLARAFARFDLDGDGVVTVEEIQEILGMDRLDAEAFVSQFDRDGDERVDYGEFLVASLVQQGFWSGAEAESWAREARPSRRGA